MSGGVAAQKSVRAMMLAASPPWTNDSQPHLWVSIQFAAEHWFNKSATYIRKLIRDGDFDDVMPYYFDGHQYYVRLKYWPAGVPRKPR